MKDIIIRIATIISDNGLLIAMLLLFVLCLIQSACTKETIERQVHKAYLDQTHTEWVKAAREARHTTTLSSYVTR